MVEYKTFYVDFRQMVCANNSNIKNIHKKFKRKPNVS